MKDYGRAASYRAEQAAFGTDRFGGAVFSQAELLAAAKEIHENYGDGKALPTIIFPKHRRGGGCAYSWSRKITLPPQGSTLVVLCHELAHIYEPGAEHGPRWRNRFVKLVADVLGTADASRLAAAFEAEGVSLSVAADRPMRKARTKPNRKWITEVRTELSANYTKDPKFENVTQVSKQYSAWEAVPAKSLKLPPEDIRQMRNGYRLSRSIKGVGSLGRCHEIRMRAVERAGITA